MRFGFHGIVSCHREVAADAAFGFIMFACATEKSPLSRLVFSWPCFMDERWASAAELTGFENMLLESFHS
jgi:hypothetical protein